MASNGEAVAANGDQTPRPRYVTEYRQERMRGGEPENPFAALIPDQEIAVVPSFTLESGVTLYNVPVAYTTRGQLSPAGDNAMVICHALTGSADVSDWWGPLLGGPGRAFDVTRFFIICLNSLGSPYGTASPVTAKDGDPSKGRYGPEFPLTTIRDDVRLHKLILDDLGVRQVAAVIGGSLGGMFVLEWAFLGAEYVRNVVPIATSSRHSAWGISWGEAQRQSIYADPKYEDGYYSFDDPPATGLGAARMSALLTYRSRNSFEARFGRNVPDPKRQQSILLAQQQQQKQNHEQRQQQNQQIQQSQQSQQNQQQQPSQLPHPPQPPQQNPLPSQPAVDTRPTSPAEGHFRIHNDGHRIREDRFPKKKQNSAAEGDSIPDPQFHGPRADGSSTAGGTANGAAVTATETTNSAAGAAAASASPRETLTGGDALPTLAVTSTYFSAQSYLRYQASKFVRRFDSNCYIAMTRKLDTHDVSRSRAPSVADALAQLTQPTLVLGIESDGLFTFAEQQELAAHIRGARLERIDSPEGHDAFLLQFEQVNRYILGFLREVLPDIMSRPGRAAAAADGSNNNAGDASGDSEEASVGQLTKSSTFGEAEVDDITAW